MRSRKVQHGIMRRSIRHNAALNPMTAQHQRQIRQFQLARRIDAQRENRSLRSQDRQEEVPVRLRGGGDQKNIDRFRDLDLFGPFCGVEFFGAEGECLFFLAVGAGEDDDFAAGFAEELDGEVAEASDAHDADAVGGTDTVFVQWSEDGGSAAHEGGCVCWVDPVRDLEEEGFTPYSMGSERS